MRKSNSRAEDRWYLPNDGTDNRFRTVDALEQYEGQRDLKHMLATVMAANMEAATEGEEAREDTFKLADCLVVYMLSNKAAFVELLRAAGITLRRASGSSKRATMVEAVSKYPASEPKHPGKRRGRPPKGSKQSDALQF